MTAQIFFLSTAANAPVRQERIRGRLPNVVASLKRVRRARHHAADEARATADRIAALHSNIAGAESYLRNVRATLAALTQATTSNMKTPMG